MGDNPGRGTVHGLPTPHPLGALLPAVMQEDPVLMRFVAALDEVLAPVIGALDSLHAYVDPRLAPPDFLTWLASWVGVELDENWPADRQRAVVRAAVERYRVRGTVEGLRAHLETVTGGRVEITDNGGVSWSTGPGAELPGTDVPRLAVAVFVDDPDVDDAAVVDAVDAVVDAVKPAHVVHGVEVRRATGAR